MLELAFIIAAIAFFVVTFIIDPIKRYFKFTDRIKPIDCTVCLSFWLSIPIFVFNQEPIYIFATVVFAALIDRNT